MVVRDIEDGKRLRTGSGVGRGGAFSLGAPGALSPGVTAVTAVTAVITVRPR